MFAAPLDATPAKPAPDPPFFDAEAMRKTTWLGRLVSAVLRRPQPLYALFREIRPILRIGRQVFVLRDADVREILSRNADFPVAFDANFQALDPAHATFILGLPDNDTYRAIRAETMRAFSVQDIAGLAAFAGQRATALLDAGGGTIDAARDLIVQVLVDVTREYYGVHLDPRDSVLWLMAMSTYYFLPNAPAEVKAVALAGSANLTPLVLASMERARNDGLSNSIAAKLLRAQAEGSTILDDDTIRVTLTGMVAGFVPTTALAMGNLLGMLLDHPDMMAACVAAAQAGDDARLDRCLFEAFRWRPINPGPFRHCTATTTIAAGTRRATTLRPGDVILAGTGSAMFDPRRVSHPNRYDPDREPSDYLHFGLGQHWCIGSAIARAHMTQCLKALLVRSPVRRAPGAAGQMAAFGPFPESMTITYG